MSQASARGGEHAQPIMLSDTILSHDQQRGVARYFRKVVEAVVEHFGDDVTICSPHRDLSCGGHRVLSPTFPGSNYLRAHDLVTSLVARRERPRLFYSPYFGNAIIAAPQVFTVHDMIHERFPQHFPRRSWPVRRFINEKRRCLERASLLLVVSASTARDIVALYPQVDARKIVVTPLGVDDHFFGATRQPCPVRERPYFLYVGHRSLYKNFARLLVAFGQSGLATDYDLRVVSPTGGVFTPQEHDTIRAYGLEQRVRLILGVGDEELREIYAGATAFVYPSEYEGFGLPILEAMASGTVVATSSVSSMPEVGGDVALYFDPCDVESIADCLRRAALLSSEGRCERIEAGIARAQSFSWRRCQEATIAGFRACMERSAAGGH